MRYVKQYNNFCNLSNGETIVELTQGRWTQLDTCDWDLIKEYKWHAHWNPLTSTFYSRAFHKLGTGRGSSVKMHRLIMGITNPEEQVDHKSHDTLDNRRQNLRKAGNGENSRNRGKHRNNKSGVLGVCRKWRKNKIGKVYEYWIAQVEINRKTHSKLFEYSESGLQNATKWRDTKALEIHKEFAYLNKI